MVDLKILEALLPNVAKPSQYLGNEVNVIKKDFDRAEVRVCLVFPDKYEIGMSHVGLKILYEILNRLPHVVCERAFAPDLDMEFELRRHDLPLFSLESKRALREFDLIGFSFTYELTFTNFLNILDLSGIPLWQKDRTEADPIILGGGGCLMNAEPIADFLDAAALGDGEELILDVVEAVRRAKDEGRKMRDDGRQILLDDLSQIEGIYIPSFFEPEYNPDGTLQKMHPLKEGYTNVIKRTLKEIDSAVYPTKLLVPSVKPIHDRIGIEIQRGCNRACRFCQAGYIDRPVRQRSPESILKIAEESLNNTGMEDISLLSLSAADYACLVPLLKELNGRYADQSISISVPATRTEKLTPDLIEQIKKVRKTGFTIAPEAGSERMRRVINKGNKVDDLYQAVTNAFSAGWDLLKLYYMVGLPFEREEDVVGIACEANASIKICLHYSQRAELNLSVSSFVPKPHTPFQWEPQMTLAETKEKHELVKRLLKNKRIRFKHHNPEMSFVEGLLSRGDRRVSKALYLAYQEGCRFDEWEEHFDFSKWERVFQTWDGDVGFYLHRKRDKKEVLPWDHLFSQMDKKFLWEEYEKAHDAAFTEDCSIKRCSNCGVCDFRAIKNRIYVPGDQAVMVKKGNREWYGWEAREASSSSKVRAQHAVPVQERLPIYEPHSILRARFSKTGLARFMGHLELAHVLKRAIKRASLEPIYSQGYHPQMHLAFGYPLPVGIESEWEYFDLELKNKVEPLAFVNMLNQVMPEGLCVLSAEMIDRQTPSLYSLVTEIFYRANYFENEGRWPDDFLHLAKNFQEQNEVWLFREKSGKKKSFNLKKSVDFFLDTFPEKLLFKIKVNPEGTVKPEEVLGSLFKISREDFQKIRLAKIGMMLAGPMG